MLDYRCIDTGLTGQKNLEILNSIIGQMSDGIWENSHSMEKYWRFAEFELDADNHVIIKINTNFNKATCNYGKATTFVMNSFLNMSDINVKDFFAKKLKQIVKIELEEISHQTAIDEWNRDNQRKLDYLGYKEKITVADAYFVYDMLKGRKVKEIV